MTTRTKTDELLQKEISIIARAAVMPITTNENGFVCAYVKPRNIEHLKRNPIISRVEIK